MTLLDDRRQDFSGAHAGASPSEILHRVYGYDRFRAYQAEIIDHVIAGGDALVLMPTGGGKSLCYQIPAMVLAGLGIVCVTRSRPWCCPAWASWSARSSR